MTTAAAVTMQDCRTELRQSGAKTMDDGDMRWLAGVATSGAWSLSSAASKAGIKLVDNNINTGNSAAGGPYTFAGTSFGDHFTDRKIVVVAYIWATTSGQNQFDADYTQISIDGVAATGSHNTGQWETGGGTNSATWVTICHWSTNSITATSGTVVVNWPGTHTANGCSILVLSMSNVPDLTDAWVHNGDSVFSLSHSEATATGANGVVLLAVLRAGTGAITWTGTTTELYQATVDTSFRLGLAFTNRVNTNPLTVGWTSSGAVPNASVCWSRSGT